MKAKLLIVALLVITVTGTTASAQDPGDIGIFFDSGGTLTSGPVIAFVPFNVYVVAFDLSGGVLGYEGSIQRDPNLILLTTIFSGPAPINVGTPENWIVGTGGCMAASGPTVLVQFQYFLAVPTAPADMLFCLGPSTPSSFAPAAPGYLDCPGNLIPFTLAANGGGIYPDGCAVGNPTQLPPVATEAESWGGLKALYR